MDFFEWVLMILLVLFTGIAVSVGINALSHGQTPADCIEFTVLDVIDGDTLDTRDGERLRLARIDAPEVGSPGAGAATKALARMIDGRACFIDEGEGYYGRTIAEIRTEGGANVSDELLEKGVVEVYR